jgi:hypothetical protein
MHRYTLVLDSYLELERDIGSGCYSADELRVSFVSSDLRPCR